MFQPLRHNNEVVGHEGRTKGALFFFGNKICTRERLTQIYPELTFCFIKQVHGNEIKRANPLESPQADGHFTRDRNNALVIQTADCMPVLLSSPKQVMAIHAGWRGLATHILKLAARVGSFDKAVIGPHIGRDSFEVGLDVANQLKLSTPADVILPHKQPDKRKVDLGKIAQAQLKQHYYREISIDAVDEDTFTSPNYHSYRRDKENAQRQYSFVALL
jgi:YfiH family protein